MMNSNKIYLSLDGIGVGKMLEKYLFQENPEALHRFSQDLTELINEISSFICECGGTVFLSGGDNILAFLPAESIQRVIDKVDNRKKLIELHFSIGMGSSLTDAYLALKYAKAIGGNPIVKYDNKRFTVLRQF